MSNSLSHKSNLQSSGFPSSSNPAYEDAHAKKTKNKKQELQMDLLD